MARIVELNQSAVDFDKVTHIIYYENNSQNPAKGKGVMVFLEGGNHAFYAGDPVLENYRTILRHWRGETEDEIDEKRGLR